MCPMSPKNQPGDEQPRVKSIQQQEEASAVQPDNPAKPAPVDARKDPAKLKQNREQLGVDDEHKTTDMQKGHRGSFP